MTRRDVVIDYEVLVGDRAIPDFVVAFSRTDEVAASLLEEFFQIRSKAVA